MVLVSLVAIAAGALVVTFLLAVGAWLIVVAADGFDATSDLLQRFEYDLPLRTRLGAAAVSLLYLGLGTATLTVARIAGGRDWRSLVALTPPSRRPGRAGIVIPAVTLIYGAGASLALSALRDRPTITDGTTDYVLAATAVANLVLLAPMAEELVFRGWLYTGLRARTGVAVSFGVTALLFAAMHWDANHRRMLIVLPLAIALGALREITGSIRTTALLHAAYNLVIIAVTLAAT